MAAKGNNIFICPDDGAYLPALDIDEYEEIMESAMSEDERVKARAELGERYGVTWHDERIPEAEARFGIGP
jgi:hypothetical protein